VGRGCKEEGEEGKRSCSSGLFYYLSRREREGGKTRDSQLSTLFKRTEQGEKGGEKKVLLHSFPQYLEKKI